MADWPAFLLHPPPIITPLHQFMQGAPNIGGNVSLGAATSSTWQVNNKAYFYPFRLTTFETAYQLLFWVGATQSGNIDVGIYDSQKNLIVSAGSTAMSATVNAWQELNITDTALPPGDYLLAGVCSTTVGTCFVGALAADELILSGGTPIYEQTTALALPDPCTPVACTEASPPRWGIGIQLFPTF